MKYLPGICFACQKCLLCFNLSPLNSCNCNKNTKPIRVSKPERGQQIYSRVYTPDEKIPTANNFLFVADTKFQYNNNFNKPFSFTFCSTCNSKFQRLKGKDKHKMKHKTNKSKVIVNVESPKVSEVHESSKVSEVINVESPKFSEVEKYDIDEIKLHVSIEKKGKKTSTSKTLTIQPVEYTNVVDKINTFVKKVLQNENIRPEHYSMSYKAMNSRGLSSELEDELDFKEFIEDYRKITAANKKMGVMVVIENPVSEETKSTEKHSSSKVKKLFYI
jgi:hypothetical protein